LIRQFQTTTALFAGDPDNRTPANRPAGVTSSGTEGTLIVEFTPSVTYAPLAAGNVTQQSYYNTLEDAFIAISINAAATGFLITDIKLEKLED